MQKILLVEGDADKGFFHVLFQRIGLNVEIKVNVPSDYGAERDGKISAFRLLPILMEQLLDGSITHLAMVVDADYPGDGWGYAKTLQKIEAEIQKHGYNASSTGLPGLSFPHSDGLSPFGVWIMPDNNADGMTENMIKQTACSEELALLQHAITTVAGLPKPKFKPIHKTKAEIATWMAWQKIPGQGLAAVVADNLIDMQNPAINQLIDWLKRIYS